MDITQLYLADEIKDSMGSYAKETLRERSIPDLRDGMLPVHRRIIYAMYNQKWFHNRQRVKSVKVVGEVIGQYHPHGDASIYNAIARQSQDWIVRHPLIDMQGNNGSIDGDPPASARYTEARLSKIAEYLYEDLKIPESIDWQLNFDESTKEPKFLPAEYPNIMIQGISGIAYGHASEIAPHNLEEILKSCILLVDNPDLSFEDLHVKGPDFPTGATIINGKDMKEIYETGKGTIIVRADYDIETHRGKRSIVFKNVPYKIDKPGAVLKIQDLIDEKELPGALTVRDESSKDVRIVVELDEDADEKILTEIIYQKTALQSNFNMNMTMISQGKPKRLSLVSVLNQFNAFREETNRRILTRQNELDKERMHIIEGFFILLNHTDDIIEIIKNSKGKASARPILMEKYQLTEPQANAILDLRIHRISQNDKDAYIEEYKEKKEKVENREILLSDQEIMNAYMKMKYNKILEEMKDHTERQTKVLLDIENVEIDPEDLIVKENTVVGVNPEGQIKRSTVRSYNATENDDERYFRIETDTHQDLVIFTNKGHYFYLPVIDIKEGRWNQDGSNISSYGISLESDEHIISIAEYEEDALLLVFRENGKGKLTKSKEIPKTQMRKYSFGGSKEDSDVLIAGFIDPEQPLQFRTLKTYKTKKDPVLESINLDPETIGTNGIGAFGKQLFNLKNKEFIDIIPLSKNVEIDKLGHATTPLEDEHLGIDYPNKLYNQDPQPLRNLQKELDIIEEQQADQEETMD